jgi:hypothetical protein
MADVPLGSRAVSVPQQQQFAANLTLNTIFPLYTEFLYVIQEGGRN